MAKWRTARSLDTLLAEVNAIGPGRSKASDGTIGNQEHAARASRHNPNDAGVVCARDITQDPAHLDIHRIARLYVARIHATGHVHPDLEYVISDRESASRNNEWVWVPYFGANPHLIEAHWAVGRGPDSEPRQPYDDLDPWDLASLLAPQPSEDPDMAFMASLTHDLSYQGETLKAGYTVYVNGDVRKHLDSGVDERKANGCPLRPMDGDEFRDLLDMTTTDVHRLFGPTPSDVAEAVNTRLAVNGGAVLNADAASADRHSRTRQIVQTIPGASPDPHH